MPREYIGVVARGGGDFLALFDFRKRTQEIAVRGRLLVAFGIGSILHARLETFDQIVTAAFQKHFRIASRFRVEFIGSESRGAGAETAANVILQAGPGMRSRK